MGYDRLLLHVRYMMYDGLKIIGCKIHVQGIHKRMVRFKFPIQLKPHHSLVYALYTVAVVWKVKNDYSCSHNSNINYEVLKSFGLLKLLELMLLSRIVEIDQWWWPRGCFVLLCLYIYNFEKCMLACIYIYIYKWTFSIGVK